MPTRKPYVDPVRFAWSLVNPTRQFPRCLESWAAPPGPLSGKAYAAAYKRQKR